MLSVDTKQLLSENKFEKRSDDIVCPHNASVLLVDDEEVVLRATDRLLKKAQLPFPIVTANNHEDTLAKVKSARPMVVVLDLAIDPVKGPESGLALLHEILSLEPTVRIIVLTGHGSEELGIRCLKAGAASFLTKPVDAFHLAALIIDGVSCSRLRRNYSALSNSKHRNFTLGIHSKNLAMQRALHEATYASSNDQCILLVGETGTGKGVIAEAIHRASKRARNPLVRYQPSFGSRDLTQSELFGHERGAFTGAISERQGLIEAANRGTFFLDEIDELPSETQVTLLNVLQTRNFRRVGSVKERSSDFRLIAASNRLLSELKNGTKLRFDLFHRIAHCIISLPPLRERMEDIEDLSQGFITNLASREKIPVQTIAVEAVSKLYRHSWPGNVRELQSVVEHAVYRANYENRRTVIADDVIFNFNEKERQGKSSYREQVESFERALLLKTVATVRGNISQAAALLELDRTSLRRILARLGIDTDSTPQADKG